MLSPYHLQENNEFFYEFISDKGIRYALYFLDYTFMFSDYPHIAKNIYSFNIEVIEGDADSSIADERIGVTIVEVFKVFFSKIHNVAVYVCDTTDKRQTARKRKFDLWFWRYNDGSIIKEDGIALIEGTEIYNSLLAHKNHPHLSEIISAFKELNERADDK